ncbi:peptidase S9 [Prevotella sp. HMSC077E09]|uniref:S9 family peptidase n=1 Tax=Prevotella sp. HMSC077E09 TaxID=1739487 RepID=UPI0008A202CB|nr:MULTISPECIES: S9 family peptidase [unclassified Prevotella]OFO72125.1 peptidase S9 [Prevotella sp. HMSC077E08]OFP59343.1 peptidase S9 [Prevotella sp. HMSC077E09]
MNKLFVMCVMMLLATSNVSADNKITLKDVTGKTFTPKYITGIDPIKGTDRYASISNDGRQIIEYAFKTGNQTRVLFDIANTHGESIKQLDGYTLSPDGKRMLIQTNTHKIYRRSFTADYYIYTIQSRKLEKLSTGGSQQIPTWSPDGNQIAFVRDNNIFLVKLLYDNAESQITKDGKFNEIINGVPDWVYEEEFSTNRSLCFTADSRMLCWIKYDERKVKEYSLQLFMGSHPTMKANEVYPGTYTYKYPKAGEDNSIVSVWSYEIQTHKTNRLQVPLEGDGYIPRIKSTNDANRIIVFTMNRHQDVLNLYAVNPRTTLSQLLIKEQGDKYVKEEAMEGIAIGQNSILLPSDRDGYMHLYLYNMNGSLIRKIGDGNYDITSIYGYDETTGDVYYQAAGINPHDRQIFVSHKNGKTERLTDTNGWNKAIFSGDYKYFLNTWSNYNTPYVFTIRDSKGKVLSTPVDNKELKEKVKTYGFNGRETFSFTTSEGVKLDGWMVKPKDFDTNKKYPVILFQYSGPGSQQVIDAWNAGSMGNGGAFDYYLAQQGFIVVCVDGRGTGGRGAAFEKCTYLKIGELESRDQIETALWLGKQSYIDKERIGIWGWSFGGFNTLMSMSEGRPVFKAGVAVAPPTNWRYYDTIYTERYMRTPKENGSGYATNPIQRANALHGALLICHGMADDNVQPQNTMEYTEALIQADKDFKENIYTNRNHGIYGGNTRTHLLRQISNWFIEHLK